MHISTDKFYGKSCRTSPQFATPPQKFKSKPSHLSRSADFRKKISSDYSKVTRDDLFGYKRHGFRFNNEQSPESKNNDIRKFFVSKDNISSRLDVNQEILNLNQIESDQINETPTAEINNEKTPVIDSKQSKESSDFDYYFDENVNDVLIAEDENTIPDNENPFSSNIVNIDDGLQTSEFETDLLNVSLNTSVFENEKGELFDVVPLSFDNISPIKKCEPIFDFDQKIPHGLKNLGNTCYLNSVIQTIFSFNFFIEELIDTYESLVMNNSFNDTLDIKSKLPITTSLLDLHVQYKQTSSTKSMIDCLTQFKACFSEKISIFESSDQQDAAEFFSFILDTLKQEIENNSLQDSMQIRNPIDRYFQYELSNKPVCHMCNTNKDAVIEKSTTIHLQLTDDRRLQSAFMNFLSSEQCQSKCSECTNPYLIEKHFIGLPKILFFQLARYSCFGLKDMKDVFAPHIIYLPKKFIQPQHNNILSPLSTPYKLSLRKFCNMIDEEKLSFVKCLNFADDCTTDEPETNCQQIEPTDLSSVEEASEEQDCSVFVKPPDDVFQYDESECEQYQILSIICHHGSTLSCGHYISYVYNFENSKWFCCNDTMVTEVSFNEVKKNSQETGYCYYYVHSTT